MKMRISPVDLRRLRNHGIGRAVRGRTAIMFAGQGQGAEERDEGEGDVGGRFLHVLDLSDLAVRS